MNTTTCPISCGRIIWGWNNAAIRNRGDSSKLSLRNNMIIRNNFIHDTVFGTGYGIASAFNSYTLIEYNKFEHVKRFFNFKQLVKEMSNQAIE